jgi:chromatin remodeling complex protein RSC6
MANSKKTSTPAATAATAAPAVQAVAPVTESKEKKAASKKTSEPVAASPAPTVVEEKKASSKKSSAPIVVAAVAAAPAVVSATPVATAATAGAEEDVETKKGGRRVVTKDSVNHDLADLIAKIEEEVNKRNPASTEEASTTTAVEGTTTENKKKKKKDQGVPVKFLKTVLKRLAVIKKDAVSMLKIKSDKPRDNRKSGLEKPVAISKDLYTFLKNANFPVNPDEKYARVQVTRMLHSYVKEKNLQKQEDKRIIVCDAPLAAMLKYDTKTATEDMTYFRLPVYLKSHFISEPKA